MRRHFSQGCKKLFGMVDSLEEICLDISQASFTGGQTALNDHQLVTMVMNLDPKWEDTINVPDMCIAPMRGMDIAQLAVYIRKNFPEQWIRMYHQIKGLTPVACGGQPTNPGIYSVTHPGGIRYRASPSSDNCVAEIANPTDRVTIIRVQCDLDGREMGLVQETNLWLPTRLASGEMVLAYISALETRLQFHPRRFTGMDEDSAYTHTDEFTNTDEMSVMSNMSAIDEQADYPRPQSPEPQRGSQSSVGSPGPFMTIHIDSS